MNSKHIIEDYDKKLTTIESRETLYKDSIATLKDQNFNLSLFDIDYNEDAKTYFENKGYDIETLLPFIKDELYKLNDYEGEEHPLVPYVSMTNNKLLINSIKILNHKWLITDFSDGEYWGELLVAYDIEDAKHLNFKVLGYTMYINY